MDEKTAGQYWEQNAEAWTQLSRKGYDIYRDYVNTPNFLKFLPPIKDLIGLDLGCGEGHNTRLLAEQGAHMYGIDIAPTFISYAQIEESRVPLHIIYKNASALNIPFPSNQFDFVVAFMSLMDMPNLPQVLKECYRVIKPSGFMQFSIIHPCFSPPHHKKIVSDDGRPIAVEVGEYFQEEEPDVIDKWIFSQAPAHEKEQFQPFQVPRFHRTLSTWFNRIIQTGFRIEAIQEPIANDEAINKCPHLLDTRIVAYFLHVRIRK
jgi:2-polyprenyl-3-methyl-5-hydroxy-6-metoxy-1,4-benzoquinol methylase